MSAGALFDVSLVALIVVSCLVALRDRTHRAYAAWITWVGVDNWLHLQLAHSFVGKPRPFTGLTRVEFHFDQLLFISHDFLLAALCVLYFVGRGARWVVFALFATWLVFLDYPYFTYARLGLLYRGEALGTQIVAWAAIAYGVFLRRDAQPRLVHLLLLFAVATEVVASIIPFARNMFGDWDLVLYATIAQYVAACVAQLWWLASHRREPGHTAVA